MVTTGPPDRCAGESSAWLVVTDAGTALGQIRMLAAAITGSPCQDFLPAACS